jgi:hypothetical protein
MNKDVIYIEPEDDITDIITRIKSSKQKVVALVPPKKLGIMRSAVNIKLISKTAKLKNKVAVIVTTDPSLVKLSALSGLPVAKTLSSRPMLPSEYVERKKKEDERLEEKDLDKPVDDEEKSEEAEERPKKKEKAEVVALDSDDVEKTDENDSKDKEKDVEKIPNFDKYRKWIIFGGIGVVLVTIALVWAFVFAPYAKITVSMKTVSSNISENVSFTTDQSKRDNKAGKFLLEQIKYEEEKSLEFDATGKANKGEKAKGTLVVIARLDEDLKTVNIPAGAAFSNGGKNYYADAATSLTMDSCENAKPIADGYCQKSAAINVTASDPGASYNIDTKDGWSIDIPNVSAYAQTAMAGGTDKNVTVVDEKDIEDARKQIMSNDSESKDKLFEQIQDGFVKIEASYKVDTADPVSSPKKGEEVADKKKAKLTVKATYTIYVVDRTAIDEYVKEYEKDKIADNDKIYSTGTPFFERFLEGTDGIYTAKFKTTVKVGPELSETQVLDTAKGKKVGEVKALLKDMSSNINDVVVDTSFPWVRWVPDDPNKVSINITVEE